ncbi:MAG: hypothetical protein AAFX06_09805 [Planctomycetota bacterium]
MLRYLTLFAVLFASGPLHAQQARTEGEDSNEAIQLPKDASPGDLVAFLDRMSSRDGATGSRFERAKAIFAAAEQLRGMDDASDEQQLYAVRQAFFALIFIQRQEPEFYDRERAALLASLRRDDRQAFKVFAVREDLVVESRTLTSDSAPEKANELAERFGEVTRSHGCDRETVNLGRSLIRKMRQTKHFFSASRISFVMADAMEASAEETVRAMAANYRAEARFLALPGNRVEFVCPLSTGESVDWKDYEGKYVLVYYWHGHARYSGGLRSIKDWLMKHPRNFAVVGVYMGSPKALDGYVEEHELPWDNLVPDDIRRNPMAEYYGVRRLPVGILIGRDGNVVSVEAEGDELDRLLTTMLERPKTDAVTAGEGRNSDGR